MTASQLIPYSPLEITSAENAGIAVPAFWAGTARAGERFVDYFTSNIRNRNTRRAYMKAIGCFTAFCEERGLADIRQVRCHFHR